MAVNHTGCIRADKDGTSIRQCGENVAVRILTPVYCSNALSQLSLIEKKHAAGSSL